MDRKQNAEVADAPMDFEYSPRPSQPGVPSWRQTFKRTHESPMDYEWTDRPTVKPPWAEGHRAFGGDGSSPFSFGSLPKSEPSPPSSSWALPSFFSSPFPRNEAEDATEVDMNVSDETPKMPRRTRALRSILKNTTLIESQSEENSSEPEPEITSSALSNRGRLRSSRTGRSRNKSPAPDHDSSSSSSAQANLAKSTLTAGGNINLIVGQLPGMAAPTHTSDHVAHRPPMFTPAFWCLAFAVLTWQILSSPYFDRFWTSTSPPGQGSCSDP